MTMTTLYVKTKQIVTNGEKLYEFYHPKDSSDKILVPISRKKDAIKSGWREGNDIWTAITDLGFGMSLSLNCVNKTVANVNT